MGVCVHMLQRRIARFHAYIEDAHEGRLEYHAVVGFILNWHNGRLPCPLSERGCTSHKAQCTGDCHAMHHVGLSVWESVAR